MAKRRKKKGWRRRILRYLVSVFGIVMFLSIALILPWRWFEPPTTAFILRDRLHNKSRIQHRWIPMSEISSTIPIAVVASEDQKFPHHHGFDFQAISAALQEDRRHLRGASTISQQLAKNLYLWPGRSLVRKALEAYITVVIELTWPKRRILEIYLNIVEFGPRVYGIDAASQLYFDKPPSGITSREAALLAAVLPSPKRMSPHRPSEYVRKRATDIEAAVRALGGPGYLARL